MVHENGVVVRGAADLNAAPAKPQIIMPVRRVFQVNACKSACCMHIRALLCRLIVHLEMHAVLFDTHYSVLARTWCTYDQSSQPSLSCAALHIGCSSDSLKAFTSFALHQCDIDERPCALRARLLMLLSAQQAHALASIYITVHAAAFRAVLGRSVSACRKLKT